MVIWALLIFFRKIRVPTKFRSPISAKNQKDQICQLLLGQKVISASPEVLTYLKSPWSFQDYCYDNRNREWKFNFKLFTKPANCMKNEFWDPSPPPYRNNKDDPLKIFVHNLLRLRAEHLLVFAMTSGNRKWKALTLLYRTWTQLVTMIAIFCM